MAVIKLTKPVTKPPKLVVKSMSKLAPDCEIWSLTGP